MGCSSKNKKHSLWTWGMNIKPWQKDPIQLGAESTEDGYMNTFRSERLQYKMRRCQVPIRVLAARKAAMPEAVVGCTDFGFRPQGASRRLQCGRLQCKHKRHATQANAVRCNARKACKCNAMQRKATQCHTMQLHAMQPSARQCSTAQCNALQCVARHRDVNAIQTRRR